MHIIHIPNIKGLLEEKPGNLRENAVIISVSEYKLLKLMKRSSFVKKNQRNL